MFRRGLWARHINPFGQLWAPKIKGFVAGVEDKGAVITKISSSLMISTTSITNAVSAEDSSTLFFFLSIQTFNKRDLREPVLRGGMGAAGDSGSLPCALSVKG